MNRIKEIIAAHPFFRDMLPEYLDIMVTGAIEVIFKPDEILFREGEPANRFFIIESGSVALEAHEPGADTVVIERVEAGNVLGWSWLFPPFVWHFQARAIEPTRAIALSGGHVLACAERDDAFGHDLMRRVAQVVIHRLQAARRQLLARAARRAGDHSPYLSTRKITAAIVDHPSDGGDLREKFDLRS